MTMRFSEIFGEQLIQNNDSNDESNHISTDELNEKTIALYFSAHWYGPCRSFTPKLVEIYKEIQNELKDKFDIVFISWDEDQSSFNKYLKKMPWKALPFSDRDRAKTLRKKYNVKDIPTLVVLSSSCDIITDHGVEEIRAASKQAVHQWIKGERLFWSRPVNNGEYIWEDIPCTQCYMNPLIGKRHGCTYADCKMNLCEKCLLEKKHEHPLVEYLQPKKHYSLEQIFKIIPYLLNPKNDEKMDTTTIWEDNIKSIGFYFAADWDPVSRSFTSKLTDLYKEAQLSSNGFRLVFVACDQDEKYFDEYRKTIPWPAVPFNLGGVLKTYFNFSGIPTLCVVSSEGKILTRQGCDDIIRKGIVPLKVWAQGKPLPPITDDVFIENDISANGHNVVRPIGKFNNCSPFEKKEHEYPLEVSPLPIEGQNGWH